VIVTTGTSPRSKSSTCTWTARIPRCTPGPVPEAVLVAWGITVDSRPVLLAIEPGSTESTDAWREFERSMIARRLRPPTLVISDGGPGLIGAVELVRPASARQRCVIHRCRNVLAKVPTHAQDQLKADFWAIWDIDLEAGDDAVAEARRRVNTFEAKWAKLYPSAVACLTDDLDHLVVYLRFPKQHWQQIRHSNFIERTFAETRRRVEVTGRLPAKRSCPSLVSAVSDRASRDWRDVEMTPKTVRHLRHLRLELLGPPPRPDTPDRASSAVTSTTPRAATSSLRPRVITPTTPSGPPRFPIMPHAVPAGAAMVAPGLKSAPPPANELSVDVRQQERR